MNQFRNYINEEKIKEYLALRNMNEEDINISALNGTSNLVDLVNFFCEGATTTLSNELFKHLDPLTEDLSLNYTVHSHYCDSGAWLLIDETDETIYYTESLSEPWIRVSTPTKKLWFQK